MTFVYVPFRAETEELPDVLKTLMGDLEKVLSVDLSKDRKLALADPKDVVLQIKQQGYYVQLPPGDYKKEAINAQ